MYVYDNTIITRIRQDVDFKVVKIIARHVKNLSY